MESKTARGPPTGRWAHPQRVRQDARRQERHPGQLEAQHLLPLLRPVQLASWFAPSGRSVTTTHHYYHHHPLDYCFCYQILRRNGTAGCRRRRRPWKG
ncbi:beta expansin2 [Zea mays]|uniref:Beta expansin2 n=1 Tax=Zea mays TaxID=4577 RepID=A0A1D6K8G6_MAIZE|nr:beta expansin2 [Zea mays]